MYVFLLYIEVKYTARHSREDMLCVEKSFRGNPLTHGGLVAIQRLEWMEIEGRRSYFGIVK